MARGQLDKAIEIGITQKAIFKQKLCQKYSNFLFEIWIHLSLTKRKTNTAKRFYTSRAFQKHKICKIWPNQ